MAAAVGEGDATGHNGDPGQRAGRRRHPATQVMVREAVRDDHRRRGDPQRLEEIAARRRIRHLLGQELPGPDRRQRVFQRLPVVGEVEVGPRRVPRRAQAALTHYEQLVASRRRQASVGEQAVPVDFPQPLAHRREQGDADGRQHSDRRQPYVERRRVRGDDREGDALGAGIDPPVSNWTGCHGERQAARLREHPELDRRERGRVEIGKRVPLQGGPEVQHGRVALAAEGQGRPQVLIGVHALLGGHFEWPARRHHLPQQQQGPLDVHLLVRLVRLLQELGGAVLGRRGTGDERGEREAQRRSPHVPGPRPRSVMRPRDTVLSAGTTMSVSKVW